VTINGPKDELERESYDIFWFQKEDDMEIIGNALKSAVTKR